MLSADSETGLRYFSVRIFNKLTLIQNRVAKFQAIQERPMLAELRIAREPDAGRWIGLEIIA